MGGLWCFWTTRRLGLGERVIHPDVCANLQCWVQGIVARFTTARPRGNGDSISIPVINALSDKFHPARRWRIFSPWRKSSAR